MGAEKSKPEEIIINNANGNANQISADIETSRREELHRDFHRTIVQYATLILVRFPSFGLILAKLYKKWKNRVIQGAQQ